MRQEDVWNLFVKTGKLEYYLKYKEMVEGKIDTIGDIES